MADLTGLVTQVSSCTNNYNSGVFLMSKSTQTTFYIEF